MGQSGADSRSPCREGRRAAPGWGFSNALFTSAHQIHSSSMTTHPSFSRRTAPELLRRIRRPLETEGAGKAGCQAGTHGPPAKQKSRRQSPQVGRTAGLPCAMVDGLYVVSPGTGLIAPVTGDALSAASPTWPQHREARTARFHRRIGYVRPHDRDHAATRRAHRILHPTSVTTAKRPLKRGGMGGTIHDFRKKERKK